MRNDDQLMAYRWAVAALLLILAAICVVWLLQPGKTFEDRREEFSDNLINYRAEVGRECTFTATTTAAQRLACDRVLNELAAILRDFRDDIDDSVTTTPTTTVRTIVPTSTATSSDE